MTVKAVSQEAMDGERATRLMEGAPVRMELLGILLGIGRLVGGRESG